MDDPILLNLPQKVDDFDSAVDTGWELLRSSEGLNRLFYVASSVGDFSVIWHILNLTQKILNPNRKRSVVRLAVLIGIESIIVNQGIKRLFRRSRPEMGSSTHPHKLRQPATSSFPSGHASSAVLAASLLSESSSAAPLFKIIAAVVATSRLHVRAHHASDVIAGALVGWFFSKLVRSIQSL
ncbi:MAG: hypothetical protein CL457_05335 [Acidimicrobiaceae bacterium]|nr:hypothetical protein [Acidimicrobiaceae bacterium]|tara:strand:+ start:768 stop:1313 length:546 start_codon:yes stop_codon:yes gene_type:complete